MNKKILIAGFFLSVMLLVPINSAYSNISIKFDNKPINPSTRGNTLYVGGSGPGNYTKIQDAIEDASDGYTVFVYEETSPYYENIVIDKSINLIGENKNTTIIDGKWDGNVVYIQEYCDGVNISGFTIQNSGYDWNDTGILTYSSYNNIIGNIISNNYRGIQPHYTTRYNNIIDNKISKNHYGIYIHSRYNNITNNTISNNSIGIESFSNKTSFLYNNISNNYNIGLDIAGSNNLILNNIFSNNLNGMRIFKSNNTISENFFFNDGIFVSYSYLHNIVRNNTVNGKPIVYFEHELDSIIDYDAGQIILLNCNNITINKQNLSKSNIGIQLQNTHDCIISNNIIKMNNEYGMYLVDSSRNTIISNNIRFNNQCGISIKQGSKNNININNISSNEIGIYFYNTNFNNIEKNKIEFNSLSGIFFSYSNSNKIIGNIISDNSFGGNGIRLQKSRYNIISKNNLSKNRIGISILDYNQYSSLAFSMNIIKKNNFLNNKKDTSFLGSIWNFWMANYWNESRNLPKPIFGLIEIFHNIFIKWLNIDWHPAKEPYDI